MVAWLFSAAALSGPFARRASECKPPRSPSILPLKGRLEAHHLGHLPVAEFIRAPPPVFGQHIGVATGLVSQQFLQHSRFSPFPPRFPRGVPLAGEPPADQGAPLAPLHRCFGGAVMPRKLHIGQEFQKSRSGAAYTTPRPPSQGACPGERRLCGNGSGGYHCSTGAVSNSLLGF